MTHEEALKPLDSAMWEMSEAFVGLNDADLWVRAHPNLLSVGELAAHIAYGQVRWMRPDLESPILTEQLRYYPYAIQQPVVLNLGVNALLEEVKRVHEACKAHILELRPDLTAQLPQRDDWTWGYMLEYMAFHIAYHTGQMYSVRHILGHETQDN